LRPWGAGVKGCFREGGRWAAGREGGCIKDVGGVVCVCVCVCVVIHCVGELWGNDIGVIFWRLMLLILSDMERFALFHSFPSPRDIDRPLFFQVER